MHILFNWEIDDKAERPQEPSRIWVYDKLRAFLKERYKPLEEQIDAATTPEHPAIVIFIWHESGDVELRFINIVGDLRKKMEDSITADDMDYVMELIGRKIDSAEAGDLN